MSGARSLPLPMATFEALPPHRLDGLDDEGLVDYVAAAHAAGDLEAERAGLGLLAFAFEPRIRGWVGLSVPRQDHDDVVIEVQASLIKASFEGKVVGQFGAFLKAITKHRAADYWRVHERRGDPVPLGNEHEGDGEAGRVASTEDETAVTELREVVERMLATRNPLHQKVIRLYGPNVAGFLDLPADEVKAAIDGDDSTDTVGVDNVAQIWSRFKRDLREELDG